MTMGGKWMVYAKKADFQAIAAYCGISPVLARLIRNRDVIGPEATLRYLRGSLEDLHKPELLPDAGKAVKLLSDGISAGRKIRVIGDYDVDGICASYIFQRVLRECGAEADAVVPDRVRDGYGMNERLVQEAADDGVRILLTCDNGIAAAKAVELAVQTGMTVIVTDHHEAPYEDLPEGGRRYDPPKAHAVVDPKLPDPASGECTYPYTEICGAAVAWKISLLLMEHRGLQGRAELARELLPFAALATVCDVMPLLDENRIIVREGLRIAEKTENTGLRALLKVTGLWERPLGSYQAAFILGPCLNAGGRLDTAQTGIRLFAEQEEYRALETAQILKDLNDRRKTMTIQQTERAMELIGRRGKDVPPVLVISLEGCHESLAGIIAGRLRETFHRPAFVLTETADGLLKGSGRSVDAYDMYGALHRCGDLLLKYGGHRMAGGLTLRRENLDLLDKRLNEECGLTDSDLVETIHIDMELPPCFWNLKSVEELRLLEPFGNCNDKPLFVTRGLTLTSARVLGVNRNVIRLRGTDGYGNMLDLIRFEDAERFAAGIAGGTGSPGWSALMSGRGRLTIDAVYYPEINSWNGRNSIQFVISGYRLST